VTGGFDLSTRDAVDWLRDLPAESVDLLITDPAYESLEKHRAVGTTTRLKHSKASSNDWSISSRTRGSASCSPRFTAC
jgi:site-specific DNA-methyltransferase (adenine-specific)